MTDIEVLGEIRCRYNLFNVKEQRYYEALSNAIQALSNASNAVPVVRCRECIEFVKYRSAKGGLCKNTGCCISEDFYCADGKRREEEQNADD